MKDKIKHLICCALCALVMSSGIALLVRSSETPTDAMLWAGVLIYSVELYKDGAMPTYIVTYEVCTTKLGQVDAIVTKKFNSLGEI